MLLTLDTLEHDHDTLIKKIQKIFSDVSPTVKMENDVFLRVLDPYEEDVDPWEVAKFDTPEQEQHWRKLAETLVRYTNARAKAFNMELSRKTVTALCKLSSLDIDRMTTYLVFLRVTLVKNADVIDFPITDDTRELHSIYQKDAQRLRTIVNFDPVQIDYEKLKSILGGMCFSDEGLDKIEVLQKCEPSDFLRKEHLDSTNLFMFINYPAHFVEFNEFAKKILKTFVSGVYN